MIRFNRLINITSKFQFHHVNFISKEHGQLYLTRLYSIHSNNKSNSINLISRSDKSINARSLILLQKRNLNQDTNAAGVWDPFPGKFLIKFIFYI